MHYVLHVNVSLIYKFRLIYLRLSVKKNVILLLVITLHTSFLMEQSTRIWNKWSVLSFLLPSVRHSILPELISVFGWISNHWPPALKADILPLTSLKAVAKKKKSLLCKCSVEARPICSGSFVKADNCSSIQWCSLACPSTFYIHNTWFIETDNSKVYSNISEQYL